MRKNVYILIALVAATLSVVVVVIRLWPQEPLIEKTFEFDGIERTYLLHVPPSYEGGTPVPLVITLHRWDQTAYQAQSSISTAKSDEEGFIAVYPEAHAGRWNTGWAFLKSDTDDVGFINELISRLKQEYDIDPDRIYVAGMGRGSGMTYRLGADLSDRIAAIATVACSIGGQTSPSDPVECIPEPSQAVSVIHFHGTVDPESPYNGGSGYSGYIFLSVAEQVAFWVKHNGCSANPQNETSFDGQVIKSVYTGGTNGTEVVLYTLVGYGHIWPTTSNSPIEASDIIWDFFISHPKQ